MSIRVTPLAPATPIDLSRGVGSAGELLIDRKCRSLTISAENGGDAKGPPEAIATRLQKFASDNGYDARFVVKPLHYKMTPNGPGEVYSAEVMPVGAPGSVAGLRAELNWH